MNLSSGDVSSMSTLNLEQAKFNMIEQQVRPWDVLNPNILQVLDQVAREDFIVDEYKNLSYADTAIPLADGQCMMHPVVEGRLLQNLQIDADDRVLEIGTGSGYITACLAKLARHVDSMEINETINKTAAENLARLNIKNVSLSVADATQNTPDIKSYDVIAVTGSMNLCPDVYKQALKIGGRLFIITGDAPSMIARLITRTDEQSWTDKTLFETSIMCLSNAEAKQEFVF